MGDGAIDYAFGELGVDLLGGGFEAIGEDDVVFGGAVGPIVEVVGVGGVAVEQLEAVLMVQLVEDGLFDVVFGDKVGHGEADSWIRLDCFLYSSLSR